METPSQANAEPMQWRNDRATTVRKDGNRWVHDIQGSFVMTMTSREDLTQGIRDLQRDTSVPHNVLALWEDVLVRLPAEVPEDHNLQLYISSLTLEVDQECNMMTIQEYETQFISIMEHSGWQFLTTEPPACMQPLHLNVCVQGHDS
jgi:hypothetical protein